MLAAFKLSRTLSTTGTVNFTEKGIVNMGAVMGKQMEKAMDESMKKQQDFMLSSQKMQVRSCGVEVSGF